MYKYKCVQIPMDITVSLKAKSKPTEYAAVYLEGVINDMANEGWEFYRIDMMAVNEKAGCFAALSGKKDASYEVGVITFRREA